MRRRLLIAAALFPLAACGDRPEARDASPSPAAAAPDLGRIRAIALSAAPGEILSLESDHHDGREMFEIKVLARSGRIVELKIDAATGAVLQQEAE